MNMKKMWKRFWTLNRHHAEGFTLVELIVVIAILAILGGVAVPAYSGYVEKAEEAADNALLAEVNTAFAAACAINGENHIGREDVSAQILKDGKLEYVGPNEANEEAFDTFYEGGEFKKFTALVYNKTMGAFDAGTAVGNGYVVSNEDLTKILGSKWAEMDSDKLLEMIDSSAGAVSELGQFDELVGSPEFTDAASKMLGQNYDTFLASEIDKAVRKQLGLGENDEITDPRTYNQYYQSMKGDVAKDVNTNLMVLLSAKEAQTAGKNIITDLNTNNPKDVLLGNLDTNPTLGLSQSALTFGLYTAFKGEGATALDMIADLEDPNSKFRTEYLAGDQVEKDLEGLLAAMNVINNQNTDIIQSTVSSGINNSDLQDALAAIMGQNK